MVQLKNAIGKEEWFDKSNNRSVLCVSLEGKMSLRWTLPAFVPPDHSLEHSLNTACQQVLFKKGTI